MVLIGKILLTPIDGDYATWHRPKHDLMTIMARLDTRSFVPRGSYYISPVRECGHQFVAKIRDLLTV